MSDVAGRFLWGGCLLLATAAVRALLGGGEAVSPAETILHVGASWILLAGVAFAWRWIKGPP